jgi:hypothetical protein
MTERRYCRSALQDKGEAMPNLRLLAGLICFCGLTVQSFAADQIDRGALPNFSSADFPWIPMSDDFLAPPSGPGPITYDKAHPQMVRALNNRGAVEERPLRLADLTNPNLKPWVIDALKKNNDARLAGDYLYASRASCRPPGVPMFLIYGAGFQPIYFIQTPSKIVMINSGNTELRHIYMNVTHSARLTPSWYGESVGHYEGEELVIDTIGFNDETLIDDNYSVPHTTQLHVIERFKLSEDGKMLQVNFTVDDPGAFNAPWSGIVRYRRAAGAQGLTEQACAENNVSVLGGRNITPTATKADF